MEDAVIIICSTPYSKRLPKKCFLEIGGKPVLEHILDRIAPLNIPTILAVPWNTIGTISWEMYESIAAKYPFVQIEKGDDNSPLHRMAYVLNTFDPKPEYVIRITHDDILVDAETIRELLAEVRKQDAGYGITPTIIEGAGVEVIATVNLLNAAMEHQEPVEFISYFVKGENCPNPKIITMKPRKEIERPYRLTLDYYEDYVVLETIFRKFGTNIPSQIDNICKFLDINPKILNYNKLPKITIYTCVKDGKDWIRETIAFASGGKDDIEHIIVDDYSTDNTLPQILENYGYFGKFRLILNEKNKGLASSSNIAISQAKGKYIMRIDVGDRISPVALEIMRRKLEETGAAICYANYDELDEDGNIIRCNISAKEHHHAGCALMNKRWLNEIRFKEGIKYWDSLELFQRIKDKFPIAYIDETLWFYRLHKDSLSRSNKEEREKCHPE